MVQAPILSNTALALTISFEGPAKPFKTFSKTSHTGVFFESYRPTNRDLCLVGGGGW